MAWLRFFFFPLFFLFIFKTSYSQTTTLPLINDSLRTNDTVNQAEVKKAKPKAPNKFYKPPGRAMLFSTILPGAGQYYTENYLKGGVMTAAWGTLSFLAIHQHLLARDALSQNNQTGYIEHRDRRNLWLWWTAAVWVFSIADAYVSSNLYKFKQQETLSFTARKINWCLEVGPELSVSLNLRRFF